jgi:2-oxoglutarate dehydrogenase complex dehydrogenase (E1) component-like enzyme
MRRTGLLRHDARSEDAMEHHGQLSSIHPKQLERIDQAVKSSDDLVATGQQVRSFTEETTEKLTQALRQATGIIGADLLANREGRVPKTRR